MAPTLSERPWAKGLFQKGGDPRRNNGGRPKVAFELRKLLAEDAIEIHSALMALVRNPEDRNHFNAVKYAHEQIIGKAQQKVEVETDAGSRRLNLKKLSNEQLSALSAALRDGMADPDGDSLRDGSEEPGGVGEAN